MVTDTDDERMDKMKQGWKEAMDEFSRIAIIDALTHGEHDDEWHWCFDECLRMGVEPIALAAANDRAWRDAEKMVEA